MQRNQSKQIAHRRRAILREIRTMIEPHLWESGYRKALDPSKGFLGGSRSLRLWIPRDRKGEIVHRDWALGGYVLETIQGVTEDGAIVDGAGGGLVSERWEGIPVEDLVKLQSWLRRKLPAAVPALPRAA